MGSAYERTTNSSICYIFEFAADMADIAFRRNPANPEKGKRC